MRPIPLLCLGLVAAACGPTGPLWEQSTSNTEETLEALYGFGPNDVWGAGRNGVVLHYDGSVWTKVTSGTSQSLSAIWGSAPNDVWIVGRSGAALRWNGATLKPVDGAPTGDIAAVRGSAANAVFLCSSSGVFFFDGAFHEFTRGTNHVPCGSLFDLESGSIGAHVAGTSGSGGELMKLTTTGGSSLLTTSYFSLAKVVAVKPQDLWMLVENAESITRLGSGAPLELVLPKDTSATTAWARSPTDVWLGGGNGALSHFDGSTVTLVAAGDGYGAPTIRALWGSPGVTWAAGDYGWLLRRTEP